MNVLFVSLTRFGDLLQTQASITDAAGAGHTVGVVCLHNFLPSLHLMQHVEHVFPFIGNSLLGQLSFAVNDTLDVHSSGNADGWLRATKELADWRDMLWNEFQPDVVIALSPARSSRLLVKYIAKDAFVGGFSVDAYGALSNSSLWAGIMQGVVSQRGIIPYNLVDIFRAITADTLERAGAVLDGPGVKSPFVASRGQYGDNVLLPLPSSVVSNTFNDLDRGILAMGFAGLVDTNLYNDSSMTVQLAAKAGTKHVTGFVGMQLGASATPRRWPLEFFARVGDYLWSAYRLVPVLLGTKEEIPLAKEYENLTSSPCIAMVGKTGVVDLGALLSHCVFLLTNDTGTMHLAAGLGVPSFAMFLATAQPFDTGPYLPGCYCFEPDLPCHPCNFSTPCPHDFVCRHTIKPETVMACIERFLHNTPLEEVPLNKARVWLTELDRKGALSLTLPGRGKERRTQDGMTDSEEKGETQIVGSGKPLDIGHSSDKTDAKGTTGGLSHMQPAEKEAAGGIHGEGLESEAEYAGELSHGGLSGGVLSGGTLSGGQETGGEGLTDEQLAEKARIRALLFGEGAPDDCAEAESDDRELYAMSRDGLVLLQRAMTWALADALDSCRMPHEAAENDHTTACGNDATPLDFDATVFQPQARAVLAEEAARFAGQFEVLEKQGEVLLLRVVELMQKRFLQSWVEVSSLLEQSPWFCFLHSPWVDLTQALDRKFAEIMAIVRVFRKVFVRCSLSLESGVDA